MPSSARPSIFRAALRCAFRTTFLALLPLLVAPAAQATEPLRPLPVAPDVTWDGPQFVGSDAKGRVEYLRSLEVEAYPVKDGELGEPRPLVDGGGVPAGTEAVTPDAPINRGLMVHHGEWLVRHGAALRWFRDGEEVGVPEVGFPVSALGFLDGAPLVAVVPSQLRRRSGEAPRFPLLLRLSGDDWVPLVEIDDDVVEELRGPDLFVPFFAHLAVGSDDTLWWARQYRYEIRAYASDGRELAVLTVGDGVPILGDEESEEMEKVRAKLEAHGETMGEELGRVGKMVVKVNDQRPTLAAVTEGEDGYLYALVHLYAENGERMSLGLDRYDVTRGVLERAVLDLEVSGSMSITSGADGLYVAAFNGERGRWMLPWETLEAAAWTPVPDFLVDGLPPLPPAEAAATETRR